jgi:hypothetical protein
MDQPNSAPKRLQRRVLAFAKRRSPFEKQHARPVEEAASVPNKPSLVPERLSQIHGAFGVSE